MERARRRQRNRRLGALVLGGLLTSALIGLLIFRFPIRVTPGPPVSASSPSPLQFDLTTIPLVDFLKPEYQAWEVAVGGGAVWVDGSGGYDPNSEVENSLVLRIDPLEHAVTDSLDAGRDLTALAATERLVWAASGADRTVLRIDVATREIVRRIRVTGSPDGMVATASEVWVTSQVPFVVEDWETSEAHGFITRIDAESAATTAARVDFSPGAITHASSDLWVGHEESFALSRIDPGTGTVVTTFELEQIPLDVVSGEGSIWVAAGGDVVRIDPKTNAVVAMIPVAETVRNLAIAAGFVWATSTESGLVFRIDPTRNELVEAPIDVEGARDVAGADGAVWVTGGSSVTEIRVVR